MKELRSIEDVLWDRAIDAAIAKIEERANWLKEQSAGYDSRGFDIYQDRANIALMMAKHVEGLKR